MNFRSDNTAPAAPEILAALAAVNDGAAQAYGEDQWSRKLDEAFSNLFERAVRVFTVATGTAANSIALASATPPWGAVICHEEAHIACDECGAPEFYSGGAKLVAVSGEAAKISPAALREGAGRHRMHAALGEAARSLGLALHMDGARFANAVAALGCAPADVTWRAGVELLSFGATKNGALAAEAIICFDETRVEEIVRRRKRGGHLFSKGRYAAAQLLAYVEGDLWLRLARRANALAQELAEAAGAHLSGPVETNQVFIKPGAAALAKLRAAGAEFYDWGPEGAGEARLVVSWDQPEADIAAMRTALAALG